MKALIYLFVFFLCLSSKTFSQSLEKSFKEIIDSLIKDNKVKNYRIKNLKDVIIITAIPNEKTPELIESTFIIKDDKCIEFKRLYKYGALEPFLNTFKAGYKEIGTDKWNDVEIKNYYWSIKRHKENFELILGLL